jgi:plasmid stabilization system protein ParE
MTYRILSPALREIADAAEHYEQESAGLGGDFVTEFETAMSRILDFPTAWSQLSDDFRHCGLQRFPYSVIYALEPDHILVVSVFCQRREPETWRGNL